MKNIETVEVTKDWLKGMIEAKKLVEMFESTPSFREHYKYLLGYIDSAKTLIK